MAGVTVDWQQGDYLMTTRGGRVESDTAWGDHKRLTRMIAAYETFRHDGRLPATYEIVYGQAWAAERATAGDSSRDGEVRIPVSRITRR